MVFIHEINSIQWYDLALESRVRKTSPWAQWIWSLCSMFCPPGGCHSIPPTLWPQAAAHPLACLHPTATMEASAAVWCTFTASTPPTPSAAVLCAGTGSARAWGLHNLRSNESIHSEWSVFAFSLELRFQKLCTLASSPKYHLKLAQCRARHSWTITWTYNLLYFNVSEVISVYCMCKCMYDILAPLYQ